MKTLTLSDQKKLERMQAYHTGGMPLNLSDEDKRTCIMILQSLKQNSNESPDPDQGHAALTNVVKDENAPKTELQSSTNTGSSYRKILYMVVNVSLFVLFSGADYRACFDSQVRYVQHQRAFKHHYYQEVAKKAALESVQQAGLLVKNLGAFVQPHFSLAEKMDDISEWFLAQYQLVKLYALLLLGLWYLNPLGMLGLNQYAFFMWLTKPPNRTSTTNYTAVFIQLCQKSWSGFCVVCAWAFKKIVLVIPALVVWIILCVVLHGSVDFAWDNSFWDVIDWVFAHFKTVILTVLLWLVMLFYYITIYYCRMRNVYLCVSKLWKSFSKESHLVTQAKNTPLAIEWSSSDSNQEESQDILQDDFMVTCAVLLVLSYDKGVNVLRTQHYIFRVPKDQDPDKLHLTRLWLVLNARAVLSDEYDGSTEKVEAMQDKANQMLYEWRVSKAELWKPWCKAFNAGADNMSLTFLISQQHVNVSPKALEQVLPLCTLYNCTNNCKSYFNWLRYCSFDHITIYKFREKLRTIVLSVKNRTDNPFQKTVVSILDEVKQVQTSIKDSEAAKSRDGDSHTSSGYSWNVPLRCRHRIHQFLVIIMLVMTIMTPMYLTQSMHSFITSEVGTETSLRVEVWKPLWSDYSPWEASSLTCINEDYVEVKQALDLFHCPRDMADDTPMYQMLACQFQRILNDLYQKLMFQPNTQAKTMTARTFKAAANTAKKEGKGQVQKSQKSF